MGYIRYRYRLLMVKMLTTYTYFFLSGRERTHTAVLMENTEALGMLQDTTNTLFLDGTFHISPINFMQVLNIAADINGRVTLLFAVPMTSKSDDLYIKVMQAVLAHEKIKGITVSNAYADFESGIAAAVRQVLPNARLYGCNFHYSQALIRKLKKPGNLYSSSGCYLFFRYVKTQFNRLLLR